jgi:hypothetical protein
MKKSEKQSPHESICQRWQRMLGPVAFCFALLSLAVGLHAQALSGINGHVTDTSGGTVANAQITATNNATNVSKVTTSNSDGDFSFTDLIPGLYTVKVELAGFQLSLHNGVGVEVSRVSTVNAVLQAGATSTTVEVQENVIALDTTTPDLNTTIENKVVAELPNEISGGRGRQIDNFIFLAPGVTGSTFSHRINGGVDFESEVVFNGIPMAQSETQGFETIWNPPFEQVNQFNVLRSSFSAQYGLAQGVVTYQTASGTNQFHGDGFEILRNDAFDARVHYYDANKSVDKENNFGFTLGGPVIIPKLYNGKNRTFFHLSFEWYRQNQTNSDITSVPTAAEKAGNFNGVATIYDPLTGLPFPNNTIPASRFSTTAKSLLPAITDPTLPGLVNNLPSQLGVLPIRQQPWGVTIDHNITQNQSIHWTEWRDPQNSFGAETGSRFALGNPLSSFESYPDLGTVFILNYSNTVTPHLIVTAGASWLGELNGQYSQSTGVNFPQAPGSVQLPLINFGGPLAPTQFGSANTGSTNRKLGIVAENNYLWIHGKHTFNFGFEVRRTYQDDNECQQCAGTFNFSNNETADPNNLATTGNGFASFLLGSVDSASRIGSQELRLRNFDISPYIQDDYKLNSKLTINFGIRWDIAEPFTELNNNVVFFNSTVANPAAGGLLGAAQKFGNCTGCAGYDRAYIQWNHIAPRFGFSYALNNKTVIQGGGAMNYLDGGAYEYGTSKVAVNYGNLLLGSFVRNSTGTNVPAYGSWDTQVLGAPAATPFSPTLGTGSNINAFSPSDGILPYDLAWSVGVQRELPYNMFIVASYAGNKAIRLPGQLNPINQLDPQYLALGSTLGALIGSPAANAAGVFSPYPGFVSQFGGSATVQQALLPYPQYASIFNNFNDTGSTLYNAMQVQLEKRYTNGLSFLVSYSLSRLMSNTGSGFSSFASASLNKNNIGAEWSVDGNDQPQIINIAATYELPIGPGKAFLSKKNVVNSIIGGWQISPLLTYAAGTPDQVQVAGNPLFNQVDTPSNRPNLVAGQTIEFSNYGDLVKQGLPVINKAAFSDPGLYAIGNAPRELSGLRNPWNLNENIAAAKSFPLGEHVRAQLRMEFFNLFNRTVFGGPNTNYEDPNFGKVINSQANSGRQGQAHFVISF